MKTKIYIIDGYRGDDYYDNKNDYNFHQEIIFDARFTEKAVKKMLQITVFDSNKYKYSFFEIKEKI